MPSSARTSAAGSARLRSSAERASISCSSRLSSVRSIERAISGDPGTTRGRSDPGGDEARAIAA